MTDGDSSRHSGLSIQQRRAVDLLVLGRNDRETGEKIGVARQTVCGWRCKNPEFVAAINERRSELWDCQTERLRGLLARAVDVLEAELDGDRALRAAVHVLKAVGVYGHASLPPKGSSEPEQIERAWSRAAERAELDHLSEQRDLEMRRTLALS